MIYDFDKTKQIRTLICQKLSIPTFSLDHQAIRPFILYDDLLACCNISYLASRMDMDTSFLEYIISFPDNPASAPTDEHLSTKKKPGSFGWGNTTPSFPNMKTTDDIAGLSSGSRP
ncbi:hypothetical protein Tsubulata_016040 [Turnera subulata]|uniref:Uncharacterized protein n=1 Tax=Turnera subulata TaxID=218843 RepID=A0A9Q0FKI6_9ROSI|nr:hypothetical protein Tsubulata_016040 [Turnera subulata]